jgi:hypothetical protein
MSAHATVYSFAFIAVPAKDLQELWEAVPFCPQIEPISASVTSNLPSMNVPIVMDMVYRQEGCFRFSAAGANTAVRLKNSVMAPLFLPLLSIRVIDKMLFAIPPSCNSRISAVKAKAFFLPTYASIADSISIASFTCRRYIPTSVFDVLAEFSRQLSLTTSAALLCFWVRGCLHAKL